VVLVSLARELGRRFEVEKFGRVRGSVALAVE